VLGIAITERSVQAVELSANGSSHTLLAIDGWENTLLGPGAGEHIKGSQQFEESLGAFLKVNRVKTHRALVALDSSFMFLHTFPCTEDATRSDLLANLTWELRQHQPESDPQEFISDVHKLPLPMPSGAASKSQQPEGTAACLGVCVRRSDVQTVSRSLSKLGLGVQVVDTDHFSAELALRVNYPDAYKRALALVGIKEHRLDVSMLRDGNLVSYYYKTVRSAQEIAESIAQIGRSTPGLQSIVTYGPGLDRELLSHIRRVSPLLVEAMNPLRHIQVSDALRIADHLSVPSYRFATAVGVALREE